MTDFTKFFIDGEWVAPVEPRLFDVVNPANEQVAEQISLGSAADVDKAVAAARRAFPAFSAASREDRLALLQRIVDEMGRRYDELAHAIMIEMGSPLWFAKVVQVETSMNHFREQIKVLSDFKFESMMGTTKIVREPIGVCGFITPWNWPINQIAAKLAPAIAAGCTSVCKPSEMAPLSAVLFAEVLRDAGLPKGVFNLINGDGPGVGEAISAHPGIDMVSFTGSTVAGIKVAQSAANTVKRVCQELGGKGANILLPGADLAQAVPAGVIRAFMNSGQSCQAPTRMLVHKDKRDEAVAIAKRAAESVTVGDPRSDESRIGPVVSENQFIRVQNYIRIGIQEGATLVTGGPDRPEGLDSGYYVRPTIFADVTPEMTIAREEIFGPVLVMTSYSDVDEAVEIANDTIYGLSGYVWGGSVEEERAVAHRLRAGRIYLNSILTAPQDVTAPFGGYKRSGNGREAGVFGFEEFHEVKAIIGHDRA
ncbi:aldehyde dehydrogenase (NAD+) [Rhodoligotrophos appendicifer]|uniref:aldehyde dehydrogenase family protein n=1 Tax=Rhodoligotrophos appendicifer TaxID=987056 RepID=UPI0011852E32|nr:aldehyde dehydrogenase family protein [Rhodoligotrophos appendicifer]